MNKLNTDSKFDIDLEFGNIGEEHIQNIFDGNSLVEVKTERDIWKDTKNVAIEVSYKGRPSGLSTTQATTWVQSFSYDGDVKFSLIFNVDKLNLLVKHLVKENIAEVKMGGDGNMSKLVLIPISEIVKYYEGI